MYDVELKGTFKEYTVSAFTVRRIISTPFTVTLELRTGERCTVRFFSFASKRNALNTVREQMEQVPVKEYSKRDKINFLLKTIDKQ